jgi:nitroimidazol reductase NimA-like FMN-containing flavoprotein (pyridoxamine 5'-phosphate oxidase superfamily)
MRLQEEAPMAGTEPVAEVDPRYSSEGVAPTPWAETRDRLASSGVAWLSTVRPDGRPHVTPLLSVWLDGAPYFCTGPTERKARNIAQNPRCVLTTGSNELHEGLDVVVEGDAVRITDDAELRDLAAAFESKYGAEWHFDVRDGSFHQPNAADDNEAFVFEVVPATVFAFRKGEYSQTRYRLLGGAAA